LQIGRVIQQGMTGGPDFLFTVGQPFIAEYRDLDLEPALLAVAAGSQTEAGQQQNKWQYIGRFSFHPVQA
jgi:hypothetical protein